MALAVSIELVSSSARATSIGSANVPPTLFETLRTIDRTPGIPGSDKNLMELLQFTHNFYSFIVLEKWACVQDLTIMPPLRAFCSFISALGENLDDAF